jgi:hypothetical protein
MNQLQALAMNKEKTWRSLGDDGLSTEVPFTAVDKLRDKVDTFLPIRLD